MSRFNGLHRSTDGPVSCVGKAGQKLGRNEKQSIHFKLPSHLFQTPPSLGGNQIPVASFPSGRRKKSQAAPTFLFCPTFLPRPNPDRLLEPPRLPDFLETLQVLRITYPTLQRGPSAVSVDLVVSVSLSRL